MKVGVFTVLFSERPFEEALDYAQQAGCEAVEVASGGYVGDAHCKPKELLNDSAARKEFQRAVESRDLEFSSLSCHGNALHPNSEVARVHDEQFRDTVRLASELGVETVVTFSGCPGDSENSERPNWVTCPWPPEFLETLEWQWNERVIPYWQEAGAFAREQGVKVAIEPHPGFVVYNTDSIWRVREAGGENIGVNFDPSHLFWQQMDPLACIRELGNAIFHVHAKDTWVDPQNTSRNGVLDTKPYTEEIRRSWIFRTVGYGHGPSFWRALASELRLTGYDGVISIEHEDSLMSQSEGFKKAVASLKDTVLTEKPGEAWWT
jgi:sugar phosphate isomerase/epimerase